MSLGFLNFVAIIGVILLFGILGYIVYKENKSGKDSEVSPIHISLINNDALSGHALFTQKDYKSGKKLLQYLVRPNDYNPHRLKNRKEKITDKKIIVKKEQVYQLPISEHRPIILSLPDKPEKLNQELKNTRFGQKMMELIEETSTKVTEAEIIRNRLNSSINLIRESDAIPKSVVDDLLQKLKEVTETVPNNPPKKPENT